MHIICLLGGVAFVSHIKLIGSAGAPGSGKGTIGRKLAQDFDLFHFSIGDFLRASRRAGHFDDQNEVSLCLDQGRLLPSQHLLPLLEAEIKAGLRFEHQGMLLDGFPRSLGQGLEFESLVGSSSFDATLEAQSLPDTEIRTRRLSPVQQGHNEKALLESQITGQTPSG